VCAVPNLGTTISQDLNHVTTIAKNLLTTAETDLQKAEQLFTSFFTPPSSTLNRKELSIPPLGQLFPSTGNFTDPATACVATVNIMIAQWANNAAVTKKSTINGAVDLASVFNSGGLLVINGSIVAHNGQPENHTLLATGFYGNSNNEVVANDPLTGMRVVFFYDPQSHVIKSVIGVIDPSNPSILLRIDGSNTEPAATAITNVLAQNNALIPNPDKWVVVSTTDLNYKADYQAAQYQAKGQDYVAALQNFKPGLGPNSSGASFTIVTK
jgi:hypothetical protein